MSEQETAENVIPAPVPQTIQHRFMDLTGVVRGRIFQRIILPLVLIIEVLITGVHVLNGDIALAAASGIGLVLLLVVSVSQWVQERILRRDFDRAHALYLVLFWIYAQGWLVLLRSLNTLPVTGKDSSFFYVVSLLFIAVTFRLILTLFAVTPVGYSIFISRIALPEQILVASNEFIAASLLAVIAGGEIAQIFQPHVFTLQPEPLYTGGLLGLLFLYYVLVQVMWVQRWNDWLSKNKVWVNLARPFAPAALFVATIVIARHLGNLSDPRTANLLGTANLDRTILALSPVIWMMIFFVVLLVWSGNKGLRERFLPDNLLKEVPGWLQRPLFNVSDMDIILLWAVLATVIPVQLSLFSDTAGVFDTLSQEIVQQNVLVSSVQQALALLFAAPFYVLAVLILLIYAYVMQKRTLSAKDRDELVDHLPVSLLIIFIITLYLSAIPFSQALIEGRLPRLPQELGQVLAFDILIPLILLYAHYFILIRIPYGRGQSRWRKRQSATLELELGQINHQIDDIQDHIRENEVIWQNRTLSTVTSQQQIEVLYRFIDLNGRRDNLNMERLRILDDRQQLAEVSETPVSLTVARLPARVVSFGIPLLLAFKIYEWAVVTGGLQEISSNPDIGVIEFFQIILEQTQF